jgi:uncharacterized protein YegL
MPVGLHEFADNPEPRCPVILLIDNSGSMSGQPIQELNKGLVAFKQSVQEDAMASLRLEVAIVTFGPVRLLQDFVTIDRFVPPQLQAEELTPMGEAIEYALDLLDVRKETYKNNGIQYYRPWIFLITDGSPTDNWQNAAQRVRDGEAKKKLAFFAVGVDRADMNILSLIAPPNRPPIKLNGLNFKDMFVWLSNSLGRVSTQKVGDPTQQAQTALQPVGWGSA